jgi:hypothetical protein
VRRRGGLRWLRGEGRRVTDDRKAAPDEECGNSRAHGRVQDDADGNRFSPTALAAGGRCSCRRRYGARGFSHGARRRHLAYRRNVRGNRLDVVVCCRRGPRRPCSERQDRAICPRRRKRLPRSLGKERPRDRRELGRHQGKLGRQRSEEIHRTVADRRPPARHPRLDGCARVGFGRHPTCVVRSTPPVSLQRGVFAQYPRRAILAIEMCTYRT